VGHTLDSCSWSAQYPFGLWLVQLDLRHCERSISSFNLQEWIAAGRGIRCRKLRTLLPTFLWLSREVVVAHRFLLHLICVGWRHGLANNKIHMFPGRPWDK